MLSHILGSLLDATGQGLCLMGGTDVAPNRYGSVLFIAAARNFITVTV